MRLARHTKLIISRLVDWLHHPARVVIQRPPVQHYLDLWGRGNTSPMLTFTNRDDAALHYIRY